MRILVVAPKRKPKIQEIDCSLKSMQELVGGTIQAIYPFREPVALVANDEGKILGLPMNRGLRDEEGNLYDILHGTFFLCGIEEDRFASLGEEYILQMGIVKSSAKKNGRKFQQEISRKGICEVCDLAYG